MTIEEWAAREVLHLTADLWKHLEYLAEKYPENWAGQRASRRLAYRDQVVAWLTEPQRRALLRFCAGGGYGGHGGAVVLRSLNDRGLAEPEAGCPTCGHTTSHRVVVTDFGREVARVLEGTP